jgi:hypothetical protein
MPKWNKMCAIMIILNYIMKKLLHYKNFSVFFLSVYILNAAHSFDILDIHKVWESIVLN